MIINQRIATMTIQSKTKKLEPLFKGNIILFLIGERLAIHYNREFKGYITLTDNLIADYQSIRVRLSNEAFKIECEHEKTLTLTTQY